MVRGGDDAITLVMLWVLLWLLWPPLLLLWPPLDVVECEEEEVKLLRWWCWFVDVVEQSDSERE